LTHLRSISSFSFPSFFHRVCVVFIYTFTYNLLDLPYILQYILYSHQSFLITTQKSENAIHSSLPYNSIREFFSFSSRHPSVEPK
jgi:succinate dehydrogenase/fumarate reductase cytochrome b subunit